MSIAPRTLRFLFALVYLLSGACLPFPCYCAGAISAFETKSSWKPVRQLDSISACPDFLEVAY